MPSFRPLSSLSGRWHKIDPEIRSTITNATLDVARRSLAEAASSARKPILSAVATEILRPRGTPNAAANGNGNGGRVGSGDASAEARRSSSESPAANAEVVHCRLDGAGDVKRCGRHEWMLYRWQDGRIQIELGGPGFGKVKAKFWVTDLPPGDWVSLADRNGQITRATVRRDGELTFYAAILPKPPEQPGALLIPYQ